MTTYELRGTKNVSGSAGLNDAYFDNVQDALQFRSGSVVGNLTPSAALASVPWLFRAVTLRAGLVARMPFALMKGKVSKAKLKDRRKAVGAEGDATDVTDDPAYASIIKNLAHNMMMVERGLLLSGHGYLYLQPGTTRGADIEFKFIRSGFMKPHLDANDVLIGFDFTGKSASIPRFIPLGQIIYFWAPNDDSDVKPGVGEVQVALGSASVLWAIDAMAAGYFNNGGTPSTLVEVPAGTTPADKADLQNVFRRQINGVWNAFKYLLVRFGVKATKLGDPLKDTQAPELTATERQSVAVALGLAPPVIDMEHANKATAQTTMLALFTLTIIPRVDWLFSVINDQFLSQYGLSLVTQPEQLEEIQGAQLTQAAAVYTMVGRPFMVINEGRGLVGYNEMTSEQEKELLPGPAAPQATVPLINPADEVTTLPGENVSTPDVQAKAVASEQFNEMVGNYSRLRKLALTSVGQAVGSPFDAELQACKSTSDVRAVFASHWPRNSEPSAADVLAELKAVTAALERLA